MAEKWREFVSKKIDSVFVAFDISRDLSASLTIGHAY